MSTTENDLYFLAQNAHRLRAQSSLTQAQLATAVGVSVKTIRNLERGQLGERFYVQRLVLLAHVFGCIPAALFDPLPNSAE